MNSLVNFGHWKASKAGTHLPPHTNAGLELVYVANGVVRWDYEGCEVCVAAHHLSFTWPWQTHGARDTRLPAVELYWILLPLVEEQSRQADPRLRDGIGLNATENRQLILLLLAEVRQALERSQASKERSQERDSGLLAVRKFWEVELAIRLGHPWTLDAMAYACKLGRTAFAAKTKELYADTPMRKLARLRTEAAAVLLRETRVSITGIAHRCGFASSQHFATVYKDYRGRPPSDERKPLRPATA